MAVEHHAAIGKMIEEYRDNCLGITCLKDQLHTLGKNLVEWGETLQTSPANVTVRNNRIVFRRPPISIYLGETTPNYSEKILDFPDAEKLNNCLTELAKASTENERLSEALKNMGFEQLLIKP